MYQFLSALLFKLEPETAHHLTLSLLHYLPSFCFKRSTLTEPIMAMGLEFPHPVGLAAGLDKNGEHLDALAKLGFSFIEIGTVTPRPQLGNPKPRLFRLTKAQAIINRMGFNNHGVEALVKNVKQAEYKGILGINIGKNADTELVNAVEDYLFCLRKVYAHASYVTVNVSSPNTTDLRQLQQQHYFKDLMNQLREEQLQLAELHERYVPLVVKVSPDETDETLKSMADVIVSLGIDGIIATNTSCSREGVHTLLHAEEKGGLSGPPIAKRSTHCLQVLRQVVGDDLTIIGVGGIDGPSVALEKCQAGANLLQLYTGLIYKGPKLINEIVTKLSTDMNNL